MGHSFLLERPWAAWENQSNAGNDSDDCRDVRHHAHSCRFRASGYSGTEEWMRRLLNFFRRLRPRAEPRISSHRRVRALLQLEALEPRTLLNSDQNAFFVAKVYPDLLHRPADPGAQ